MIEDESGRVRLVGEGIESGRWKIVTGMSRHCCAPTHATN
jgi:hypothetical protein